MQSTQHILMIRPAAFRANPETMASNAFQAPELADLSEIQTRALKEFDRFVTVLRDTGVDVMVVEDSARPIKPDAIFPNNWVSFHENGQVFLYPMQAENRRWERRTDIFDTLKRNFFIDQITDLSGFEGRNEYLEGTGSMVLDHVHKIAYACRSLRTSPEVLKEFAKRSGYVPFVFEALDAHAKPIYHTNVLMCVGTEFMVVCLECIRNPDELAQLVQKAKETQKEIIPISLAQMSRFAGNVLEVQNAVGEKIIVMSSQAYEALNPDQKSRLLAFGEVVHTPLYTIEHQGGGSARCMMAEIYLPKK